jgi:hypothetical protein
MKISEVFSPRQHQFVLEKGSESMLLPPGYTRPTRVWLISLRDRPLYVSYMPPDKFEEAAKAYRIETNEMPIHLKGIPLYYTVKDREIRFWPVPAHTWNGVLERQVNTMEARADA